ncbi:MAG TPA: alpha/beta hydrolase [Dehalococcoidia bacterium]|nr:alpha/beta hydrolase [Dehalococcoidia bacterium]
MNLTEYEAAMDPELREGFARIAARFQNPPEDPVARRNQRLAIPTPPAPRDERVRIEDRTVPGPPGAPEVPVRIYAPAERSGALPGMLWIHGGGFTAGTHTQNDALCQRFVTESGCLVVSAGYRLAPEHPFPAPPEDCYAALRWLAGSAGELGVDGGRIAIGGGSAGGGLAAGVALMARDRGEIPLVFELLIYPCLDDRHETPSSHEIAAEGMVWYRDQSQRGWRAYLGSDRPAEVSPYAAPARVVDVAGLPPTFLMVGTLDLMRDENIAYAQRLMQAGIATELHVYPGAFHGFYTFVPEAPISRRATDEMVDALGRALRR